MIAASEAAVGIGYRVSAVGIIVALLVGACSVRADVLWDVATEALAYPSAQILDRFVDVASAESGEEIIDAIIAARAQRERLVAFEAGVVPSCSSDELAVHVIELRPDRDVVSSSANRELERCRWPVLNVRRVRTDDRLALG